MILFNYVACSGLGFPLAKITDEEARQSQIASFITFKTKQEYLEWRANWCECLRDAVAHVRACKALRRDTHQHPTVRRDYQRRREEWRVTIHNMMLIRQASKKEAGRQWLEQKAKLQQPLNLPSEKVPVSTIR